MRKIDLPLILDVLFYTVAAWFLSVGILRYFRAATWVAMLASTLIALAAGGVSFALIFHRHRRRSLTKAERERKEKLLLHLALEREKGVADALSAAFLADGKQVFSDGGALVVEGETVVPLFTMQPLSADAVANVIRTFGETPFVLACNALTPEAEKLLASFGRKAMRADEIFSLFERTGTTPERLICGEIPRPKLKARLRRVFSKKNARPFFTGGILLLFMSLFTFFPLYYLITGSILLLSSVFIRVLGYA